MKPIAMKLIDMSGWDARMDDMYRGRNARDIYDMGYMDALAQVDDWLDAQPTLTIDDLRPKGRWVPNEPESDVWFHCSECETDISTSWDYDCDQMWNYCPNCGADMRGGGTK